MTGLSLRDIVNRAYHKSGETTVAEGLIHFLDEKLLGSDEPVPVSEVRYRVLHVSEVYESFCYKAKDLTCRRNEISAALQNPLKKRSSYVTLSWSQNFWITDPRSRHFATVVT